MRDLLTFVKTTTEQESTGIFKLVTDYNILELLKKEKTRGLLEDQLVKLKPHLNTNKDFIYHNYKEVFKMVSADDAEDFDEMSKDTFTQLKFRSMTEKINELESDMVALKLAVKQL